MSELNVNKFNQFNSRDHRLTLGPLLVRGVVRFSSDVSSELSTPRISGHHRMTFHPAQERRLNTGWSSAGCQPSVSRWISSLERCQRCYAPSLNLNQERDVPAHRIHTVPQCMMDAMPVPRVTRGVPGLKVPSNIGKNGWKLSTEPSHPSAPWGPEHPFISHGEGNRVGNHGWMRPEVPGPQGKRE